MDAIQGNAQKGDEASLKQLRSLLVTILLQHPIVPVLHSVLRRIGDEQETLILNAILDDPNTASSGKVGYTLLNEGLRKFPNVNDAAFPSCLLGIQKCFDFVGKGLLPEDLLRCKLRIVERSGILG